MSAERIRHYTDRVLRLKEEGDALNADVREVYAEAKAEGFDKTALGQLVTYLRKRAKHGSDAVDESDAIFATYLAAYDGQPSHARAREENIEEFDPDTGEITESGGGSEQSHPGAHLESQDGAVAGPDMADEVDRLSDAIEREGIERVLSDALGTEVEIVKPIDPGPLPDFLRRTG